MFLGSHLRDYSPPGGRIPPPEVVRGLREIDPRMELVYVGEGKWLMGKCEYARDRWEQAARTIENLLELFTQINPLDVPMPWEQFVERAHNRMRERLLTIQGFQPIKGLVVREHQLHSGLVEWFRMIDWTWRFGHREDDREREALEDGTRDQEAKMKEVSDRFDAVHKDVHHRVFRGSKSFKSSQIPGGNQA